MWDHRAPSALNSIASLVFMELFLIDTSVARIRTGTFSHPKTTGTILSSELTQCFS